MKESINIPNGIIVCGIYKITNPKGKVYIGESKDIYKRWKIYRKTDCKKQRKLHSSLKSYGIPNHTFEIIEECLFEDLLCRERHWQDFYDVTNRIKGLNLKLTTCGDIKGEHSEETRKRIGEGNKGTKRTEEVKKTMSDNRSGDKNPMFGVIRPKEWRENHSNMIKGRVIEVDDTRIKIILCTETGVFYYGIKDAAKAYNVPPNTIQYNLQRNTKRFPNLIYV